MSPQVVIENPILNSPLAEATQYFIACLDDRHGPGDLLNLVIAVRWWNGRERAS